ncbi:hypothetical protein, conserved [Babesia bigemina]|uniref:Uncharacterized protein n=1 Tax=Babesia bigemina TaxID=5866 RepID=A0A061DC25_BABBI|nr:hypothetical protein, conserved [Babesia bigemina]CDR97557.1 hypothetical protein, conserved [Babesia bigemina]|eukprot:XP_012769743.1 hypothetical protein, conserved [Babesia bigemina]
MAWSQCSNTLHCTSKFYDECESASESFLYRERQTTKSSRSSTAAATGSQRKYNLLVEISRSLSWCFGRREGEEEAVGAMCRKPPLQRTNQLYATKARHILWTIEPTTSHRHESWTLNHARWMALAWASRVTNGEPITRRMMNGLLVNAMRSKNAIEGITKAVMKNFQGLELVDNISCFETVDQTTAIDTIVDALSEHSAPNRFYFAIIVKKDSCCYAVYYNHRGDERDVVLLECGVPSKHGGIKCGRMIGFNRLEA